MRTRGGLPDGPALWRYLAAWLLAGAAVVAAAAVALHDGSRHPERLELAAERASCRFVRDSDRPLGGGVVVTYRSTLNHRQIARVRDVARRLAAPGRVERPDVRGGRRRERRRTARVDASVEDAITLFVLASELDD